MLRAFSNDLPPRRRGALLAASVISGRGCRRGRASPVFQLKSETGVFPLIDVGWISALVARAPCSGAAFVQVVLKDSDVVVSIAAFPVANPVGIERIVPELANGLFSSLSSAATPCCRFASRLHY